MATKDLVYNYKGIQGDPSIENNDLKILGTHSFFQRNSSANKHSHYDGSANN